jgi:hypothetical protein
VIRRARNEAIWLNISVAYEHRYGNGFYITMQTMPLDSKLVLRRYDEEPPKETKGVPGSESDIPMVRA